ncbi:MAG: hypothetical protein NTV05_05645 [Acidobacteria bacterium]|nr:hypothetical protein [Acidobacteriota bacterium]
MKKNETRECMFCDRPASSKEDAWPLWLVRMFPASAGVMVESHRKETGHAEWRQYGHFAKARFACESCNNGWMSNLENQAKPIIQALLSDTPVTFSGNQREIAARWTLKTAMVFEAVGGRGWFYTREERAVVRSGHIPAGYTAFWASRCMNLPGAYSAANNMFESADLSRSGVHGHVTTLAIGTLALQVITVRPSVAVPLNAVITIDGGNLEPWPRTALQLWPPTIEFEWPPAMGLDGEGGVESLASRFR